MSKNVEIIKKEQLNNMSLLEMNTLASEIRKELINNISKTGGHLASNLGVVELTIAVEKIFDTPKDKVVWDVGHQTYVHKMLTGRWSSMNTLRQIDGISGFPKRGESEHDMFDSGHSGTSISVALGFAKARDLMGESYSCVAIIGDGALTGGVAYEALNSAGTEQKPLLVILNDNEMSISKNVGGIARHLQHLRISASYLDFKKGLKKILASKPKLEKKLERIRDSIKYAIVPAAIFEELGFKYFGPIDGHDIKALTESMQMAKKLKTPVLLHVVTKKGKGYLPAEKHPDKYHGTKPFNPETGCSLLETKDCMFTDIFGQKLVELATSNEKIVAVTAAMTEGTGLLEMKEKFSDRVFDAGIAEQHAVSFAVGLALNGMHPVVSIYSTFLQRAYDQIIMEVCLQNLPIVFAIDRAGNSGDDGETHHGQFDLSYLNTMPNMTILAPKDGIELSEMLEYALSLDSPCAIRYPKGKAIDLSDYGRSIMDGKPEVLWSGTKNAIIAVGSMTQTALAAAKILKDRNVEMAVINIRTVKPIEANSLYEILKGYTCVVTLEDGTISGGAGMQLAAKFSRYKDSPVFLNMGWPDEFIPHGMITQLHQKYGLDALSVANRAEEFFEEKA
ncbi:MAG: 1-deoxy-D-xylulose-5-phosphate synthase [Clostridia bacterium]|nr:1-deoxy-D-xylulose-5-phosphate synthase [Clostridia bacterium]